MKYTEMDYRKDIGAMQPEIQKKYNVINQKLQEQFEFRNIREEEAEQTICIEKICFPPNEACTEQQMRERIKTAPELFLTATDRKTGKIAGFLNGLSTNEEVFRDEFFMDASLHDPEGRNIMLLGFDVLPEYRGQGLARELMYTYMRREKEKGRKRLLLTCVKEKVPMYEKMGYTYNGDSGSVWGGTKWYDMDCVL